MNPALAKDKADENSNTNSFNDSNLLKYFKLDTLSGIAINSVRNTNVIYVNTSVQCTQFDVNFTVVHNLSVDMKIVYPRLTLFSNEIADISKLRINVNDEQVRQEIISCVNYLQRQRNVNLAVSILKKCAVLIAERKLLVDMLMLHTEGCVSTQPHEDGGIVIRCENKKTGFKYFESLWKIQFDCVHHFVIDFIDFSLTTHDRAFHDTVRPIMKALVKPKLLYPTRVELWWQVIEAVKLSLHQDVEFVGAWEPRDFARVHSAQEINSEDGERYEILESDDEDCIVIEDD